MKNVLKQIGKALGYFAVYLAASNAVTAIVSFVLGVIKGYEAKQAGLSFEEGQAAYTEAMNSMTGWCLLIGAVLTLVIFAIVEKVKKTNLPKEADIKRASARQIVFTVIGALGGMFFTNFIMSYLPIPAELISELYSGMDKLTAYPFWLAVLADCIAVPLLEEVVFRGYIFNRLSKAMPAVVAALISSAVFGICHGGLLWAVWAFVLGMLICVVRIKSGSIVPGIIFHVIVNLFGIVTTYFPVLDNMAEEVMLGLTIVGGVLVAVYVFGVLTDKSAPVNTSKAEVVIKAAKEM